MSKHNRVLCPKCGEVRKRSGHHMFPRKFFPNSTTLLYLCKPCHRQLHNILPMDKKYKTQFYVDFVKAWLKGGIMVKGMEVKTDEMQVY